MSQTLYPLDFVLDQQGPLDLFSAEHILDLLQPVPALADLQVLGFGYGSRVPYFLGVASGLLAQVWPPVLVGNCLQLGRQPV